MAINKDLKNITTNLRGALTDAQPAIDKVGNTIGNTINNLASNVKDIGSNFLNIGKFKRMKSTLFKAKDGLFSYEKNANAIITNPDGKVGNKDWRVSVSVPSRIQEYGWFSFGSIKKNKYEMCVSIHSNSPSIT